MTSFLPNSDRREPSRWDLHPTGLAGAAAGHLRSKLCSHHICAFTSNRYEGRNGIESLASTIARSSSWFAETQLPHRCNHDFASLKCSALVSPQRAGLLRRQAHGDGRVQKRRCNSVVHGNGVHPLERVLFVLGLPVEEVDSQALKPKQVTAVALRANEGVYRALCAVRRVDHAKRYIGGSQSFEGSSARANDSTIVAERHLP